MATNAPWTLERIEEERPELAPLARLHRVLAEETLRFATDGGGPAARPAFAGPPAVHWIAGRALLRAAHPAMLSDLVGPLTARLATRLAAEFEDVATACTEIRDAVSAPGFPWPARLAEFMALPGDDDVPHPALFRFLLLRALAAPATHIARSFSPPHPDRWSRSLCPYCGLPPAASVAQPDEARRLLCVLCGGQWTVPGLGCAACGEERADHLRVLGSRELGPATLEACDSCGLGVKVFAAPDLAAGPPLALEILTLSLDVVAARDEDVRRDAAALAAVFPPE